jgi:GntR family transcriptional regulator, uxu operon transcriptional repressor
MEGTAWAIPARSGRQLAEEILAESRRAGLGPGSRLPTERQLAVDLGVTRSGIRQALGVLEADGLITREVGRGTFFSEAAGTAFAGGTAFDGGATGNTGAPERMAPERSVPATDFAPADVMTIRRLLEPQAMPLVVMWATARDFTEMERCVAGGDRAVNYEEFETWDLALHRCIMAAAHSPLLSALYGLVESARHGQVWGDLKRRSASSQRRALYQEDHRAIVAALRARDADEAIEAMRGHLARVAGHLLGETR